MSGTKSFRLSLTDAKLFEIQTAKDLVYMNYRKTLLNNKINQQCAKGELDNVSVIISETERLLSSRTFINDEDAYNKIKGAKNRFQHIEKKINHKNSKFCRLNEDLQYMVDTYNFIDNPVNEKRAKEELNDIKNLIEVGKKIIDKKQITDEELSRNFLKEFENLEQNFRKKITDFHNSLREKQTKLIKAKSVAQDKLNTFIQEFGHDNETNNWLSELSNRKTQMEKVDEINHKIEKKIEQKIEQKIQRLQQEADRKIRLDTFKQALDKCNEYDEIEETTEKENIILKASKKEKHGIRTDTFVFTLDNLDVVDSDFEMNENICSGTAQRILDHLYDFGLVNEQASVDCQTINKKLNISQTKTMDKKKKKSKRTNRNKTQNSLKRGA